MNYPKGKTAGACEGLLREEFDPDVDACAIGDIVISMDHVRAQAAEYGHSERRECGYLLTHGLFHLMGYDHMTDEDKAFARRAIADYKLIRPVVQQGDLYRLISPFDKTGYASLMYVSPEKDHAAYFVYKLEQYHNMPRPAFRMAGLDPQKRYLVRELSLDGKPIPQDGKTFTGAFLMETGLDFEVGGEHASHVLELKAAE